MSGAGFILAISLAVAALLAAAFAALAAYDRERRAARWACASHGAIVASLGLELAMPLLGLGRLGAVAVSGGFLLANVLFNAALSLRGGTRPPWPLLLALAAASLAGVALSYDWPPESLARQLAGQLPYAAMNAAGLAIVLRASLRSRLDTVFATLLGLNALHFALKPFLGALAGAGVVLPRQAEPSGFAMTSLSLVTVFVIALALCLLVLLVRDSLHEAVGRSETDALSGLLNRAGFQRQGTAMLTDTRARGVPFSLVITDLDHFKTVNDTFGHGGGDRVIAAFAALLRLACGGEARLARIGGEEFAVMMPGAALPTARLWAESTRHAFAARAIEGLPPERAFTASFGVAECGPGEALDALLARADTALYEAKAAGRDCVRASLLHRSDRWDEASGPGERGTAGPDQDLPAATAPGAVTRRYSAISAAER